MGLGVRVRGIWRSGAQRFASRAGGLHVSEVCCLSVTLHMTSSEFQRILKRSTEECLSGTHSNWSVLDRTTKISQHWGSWWRIKAAFPMGRTSIRREKVGPLPSKGGEGWDLKALNSCHSEDSHGQVHGLEDSRISQPMRQSCIETMMKSCFARRGWWCFPLSVFSHYQARGSLSSSRRVLRKAVKNMVRITHWDLWFFSFPRAQCLHAGLPLGSWTQSHTHLPSPAPSVLKYLGVKGSLNCCAGQTWQEVQWLCTVNMGDTGLL